MHRCRCAPIALVVVLAIGGAACGGGSGSSASNTVGAPEQPATTPTATAEALATVPPALESEIVATATVADPPPEPTREPTPEPTPQPSGPTYVGVEDVLVVPPQTLAEYQEMLITTGVLNTGSMWISPTFAQIAAEDDLWLSLALSADGDRWQGTFLLLEDHQFTSGSFDFAVLGPVFMVLPQRVENGPVILTLDTREWQVIPNPEPAETDDGLEWFVNTVHDSTSRMLAIMNQAFVGLELRAGGAIPQRCDAPCRDSIGFGDDRVEFTVDLDVPITSIVQVETDGTFTDFPDPGFEVGAFIGTPERPIALGKIVAGPVQAAQWNGSAWEPTTYNSPAEFTVPRAWNGRTYVVSTTGQTVTLLLSDDDGETWTDGASFDQIGEQIGRIDEFAGGPDGQVALSIIADPHPVLYSADGVSFETLATFDLRDPISGISGVAFDSDGRLAYSAEGKLEFAAIG